MPALLKKATALSVVLLACLATVATSHEPTPAPPPAWSTESAFPLLVGMGQGRFAIYEEGDPVPVERGFQGGQHVNALLRAPDLAMTDAVVIAWVVDVSDESVVAEAVQSEASFAEDMEEGAVDDSLIAYTRPVFVDEPDLVIGREVELRVQVTLPDGRVGRVWHRGVGAWLPDSYWNEPDEERDAGPVDADAGLPRDAGQ